MEVRVHVAIIGNGITGMTAALRLRELQPDWEISMISGESKFPYSRPALMYVFMGHMRYQDTKPFDDDVWDDQRIELVRDWVTGIDVTGKQLNLHRSGSFGFDKLLIATGSKSNKFGWPGQDLEGVQGLYDLMDLEQLYANVERTKNAMIVGGGLIGIELAEMLHSAGVHVTFLVRESSYWNNILPAQESAIINRLIRGAGIDLLLETELREIQDDGTGRVGGVVTKDGRALDCQLVGLTAGVSPNTALAEASGIPCGRGVLVDWRLQAQVPNVFAAGDCAEIVKPGEERNLIQQVWYTGKMQGRVAAENLAGGGVEYDPGIWYNSAKFLDLEYHTYGMVFPSAAAENSVYWEHASGMHCLRLVHDDERRLVAMDSMGLRMRHEVFEPWIAQRLALREVIDRLAEARFDPEFSAQLEPEIASALRDQLEQPV
ncbi:MAG: NAD(P)/FAD-dependent oxidoreductase [bacterium]|nr:NAD(P)/FAD-dependent oxidoreductase [bacterium]